MASILGLGPWGDNGMYNISAYHRGMMGGTTPNIDRLAAEGALFTDHYAQQSCTAGRAAGLESSNRVSSSQAPRRGGAR